MIAIPTTLNKYNGIQKVPLSATLSNPDVNVLIPFQNLYRWVPLSPLCAIYAQSVGDSQVILSYIYVKSQQMQYQKKRV